MNNQFAHHERAAALTVASLNVKVSSAVIKLGLDIHSKLYGRRAIRSRSAESRAAVCPTAVRAVHRDPRKGSAEGPVGAGMQTFCQCAPGSGGPKRGHGIALVLNWSESIGQFLSDCPRYLSSADPATTELAPGRECRTRAVPRRRCSIRGRRPVCRSRMREAAPRPRRLPRFCAPNRKWMPTHSSRAVRPN